MSLVAWRHLTLRHSNRGETPRDVVTRVLDTVKLNRKEYQELLLSGSFLPAGRTLKTARPGHGVLPNCVVVRPSLPVA